MQQTIIDEVYEWYQTQIQTNPLSKETLGEIIERGNQAILKEYKSLHNSHVELKTSADILSSMVMEEAEGEDMMLKNMLHKN